MTRRANECFVTSKRRAIIDQNNDSIRFILFLILISAKSTHLFDATTLAKNLLQPNIAFISQCSVDRREAVSALVPLTRYSAITRLRKEVLYISDCLSRPVSPPASSDFCFSIFVAPNSLRYSMPSSPSNRSRTHQPMAVWDPGIFTMDNETGLWSLTSTALSVFKWILIRRKKSTSSSDTSTGLPPVDSL